MKTKLLKTIIATLSATLLLSACSRSGKEASESLPQEVRQSPVATDANFVKDPKCLKVSEFLNALTGDVKCEKTDKGYILHQKITDEVTKNKTEISLVFERFPNQNAFLFSRIVVNGVDGNETDIENLYAQIITQVRGVSTDKH